MENRCKNCQNFERSMLYERAGQTVNTQIGRCVTLENNLRYYNTDEEAACFIDNEKIGCENLYVSQNFGCIHFKPKDNER